MKTLVMVALLLGFIISGLPSANAEAASPYEAPDSSVPPGIVNLDSLTDKYTPVLFDHEMHLEIAETCEECHHQHGNNSSLLCNECHNIAASLFRSSVTGSFTACRDCHGEYDPASPGMPGLKVAYHRQCFQCHRGIAGVGVEPKACAAMCHYTYEQEPGIKKQAPQAGMRD